MVTEVMKVEMGWVRDEGIFIQFFFFGVGVDGDCNDGKSFWPH